MGQVLLTSRTPEDEARAEEEEDDGKAGDEAGLAANGSCLSAVASESFECRACRAGFFRVEGGELPDFAKLRAEEKDRDFGREAIWRVVEEGLEVAVCLEVEAGSEYRRLRDEDDVPASRCGCSIELRSRFFRSASFDLET